MIRTQTRQLAAAELLAAGDRWLTGTDLTNGVRGVLASGTVYPILKRFHEAGWVDKRREDGTRKTLGRPPRIYYRLTQAGILGCREYLVDRPDLLLA